MEIPRSIASVRLVYDLDQETDHTRFEAMNRYLFDQADGFFNRRLGTRSERLPARLSVLKNSIRLVRDSRENPVYKEWLALSPKEAAARGENSPVVISPPDVKHLQAIGDPAVHAVAFLERIRKEDFPNLEHELTKIGDGEGAIFVPQRLRELEDTYDIFLNGVHDKRDDGTQGNRLSNSEATS